MEFFSDKDDSRLFKQILRKLNKSNENK